MYYICFKIKQNSGVALQTGSAMTRQVNMSIIMCDGRDTETRVTDSDRQNITEHKT